MPRGSSVTNYMGAKRRVARGTGRAAEAVLEDWEGLPRPRITAFAQGKGPVPWRSAALGLVTRAARDLGLSARE